jgi:TIR domain
MRYGAEMADYELILLGSPPPEASALLTERISTVASAYGMVVPDDLAVRTAGESKEWNIRATMAALYFGGDSTVDAGLVADLEAACVPIVPVVPPGGRVSETIPTELQAINAFFDEPGNARIDALAALALECLGLLRRQRRVFVSYRRDDSRVVAVQLHDELSGKGFDVFLDTHDILPGDVFQEMLWHRLADCDVVIMLDTKDYFGSKWTKQELGRSLAQGIQILRVIWPGHEPTRHLSLSDALQLNADDFDLGGKLIPLKVEQVVRRTESLRSRSVATRHREIVDLPGKSGEHQLRNQEVFYGKREQTDAGVSA